MAKLKAKLTKQEFAALPATIDPRELYGEEKGGYVAVLEAVDGLKVDDTDGLRATVETLRREKAEIDALSKTQAEKLKAYEGIDPARARDALVLAENLKGMRVEDKAEEKIKAARQELVDAHAKEKAELQARLDRKSAALDKHLLEGSAVASISKHKGSAELALPHVRAHLKVIEDNGESVLRVVDAKGNVRYSAKAGAHNAPMDVDELVAEMRSNTTYAPLFGGVGARGSGAPGMGQGTEGNQQNPALSGLKNPVERLRAYREQNAS